MCTEPNSYSIYIFDVYLLKHFETILHLEIGFMRCITDSITLHAHLMLLVLGVVVCGASDYSDVYSVAVCYIYIFCILTQMFNVVLISF